MAVLEYTLTEEQGEEYLYNLNFFPNPVAIETIHSLVNCSIEISEQSYDIESRKLTIKFNPA